MSALKKHYLETVVPALISSRGYHNLHEVPRLEKVVINSGISAAHDRNYIHQVAKEIGLIAGQKPVLTKARKSISNFKLRQGMPIGVKVTLRGPQMYAFLERLLAIALPNVRDFQGVSRKLDGRGNYNLGIKDHSIFPEIAVEPGKTTLGFDITIVTSSQTDDEARELLTIMGMPFRRQISSTTQA